MRSTAGVATGGVFVGGGMSYTHGYLPVRNHTVMLDMRRMNRVIELNMEDMYITVQPGVTWAQLREALARGQKEVVLTGVDLTSYGADLPNAPTLFRPLRLTKETPKSVAVALP